MTPETLRYIPEPAIQTPIIVDDRVTGWVMKVTLRHNNITHSVSEIYNCEPDEILHVSEMTKKAGPLLEEIHKKVNDGKGLLVKCVTELDAMIAEMEKEDVPDNNPATD